MNQNYIACDSWFSGFLKKMYHFFCCMFCTYRKQPVVYSIWFYCALHEEKLYTECITRMRSKASTALLGDGTQHVPEHFCA